MILAYSLHGFENAQALLRRLGSAATPAAELAIEEGADVIAVRARELAPRRQGPVPKSRRRKKRLHQSIVVSKTLTKKSQRLYGGVASVERWIGPTAPHAPRVEFGHALVKVRRSQRAGKRGKVIARRVIGHVPAKPFMRPAEAETRAKVTEVIAHRFVAEVMHVIEPAEYQAITRPSATGPA